MEPQNHNDLLNHALAYAARGWPVVALHTAIDGRCTCGKADCESIGKHPRTEHGLKDATTDPAQLAKWWQTWPNANIALVAGRGPGFFVLDVDPDKGGADSLADLEAKYGPLPDTVEAITGGGGRHILFKWPAEGPDVTNSPGALKGDYPGLDVRGQGGYIVATPSMHQSGQRYAWELSSNPLDGVALAEAPAWFLGMIRGQATQAPGQKTPGDKITQGGRNEAMFKDACALRRRGLGEAAILAAELADNQARYEPPLPESEVRKIVHSSAKYAPAAQDPGPDATPGTHPDIEHLSDLGNAKRLVRMYGRNLRYVEAWGWRCWDGQRWAKDETGAIWRMAKETALSWYDSAEEAMGQAQEATLQAKEAAARGDLPTEEAANAKAKDLAELAGKLGAWAHKSQARQRIEAMVALAQSEAPVVARAADFDADPWALNCANGTLDLRTGALRPHRREDLITRVSPVAYTPGAQLDTWRKYLDTVTQGNNDLKAYLQRAAGYSLTGSTAEEVFFLLLGPTNTGKTTYESALASAMGDYAARASFETFLSRPAIGAAREDVAQLAGARLVVASEVEATKHLAEPLLKEMTGGDLVTARYLFKNSFTFRPVCKIWLAANASPRIRDDDSGIWRRLRRLPFEYTIPEAERDPNVKADLCDPTKGGPAVLAWAVAGCLAWQHEGLGYPDLVREKTAALREEMDPLKDFISECCILDPRAKVSARDLREAYGAWAKEGGQRYTMGDRERGERLRALGCTKRLARVDGKPGQVWYGIGLQASDASVTDVTDVTDDSVSRPTRNDKNVFGEVTKQAVTSVTSVTGPCGEVASEGAPGGNGHGTPEAPAGWREVPYGGEVPEGSTVRFDMATGRTYVKMEPAEGEQVELTL